MKAAVEAATDKKGHVCPPSNATHPRDRWEAAFVYSFICKFTQLRAKTGGALLSPEPNPIITQILARFILNLRPQTRNLSSDVISDTLATVTLEYLKTSERSIFWDEDLKANLNPFLEMQSGFFAASWDFKLKIMRQLVELQLCHSGQIKAVIDRAWGVIHNKHKKSETTASPPPPNDPQSRENLQMIPMGQDKDRKRYWAVDVSPRLYVSTNPWKITATFQAISSTREEYIATIDRLRTSAPKLKEGQRPSKMENAHMSLVEELEKRLEAIDADLLRIQRARKKLEMRNLMIAQAEVRETRTRRKATRPDYAYMNDPISEDEQDEYQYQEQDDDEYDDHGEFDDMAGFRSGDSSTSNRYAATGKRRSSRAAATNGHRDSNGNGRVSEWRGERRSSRLGASVETQLDEPPPKRARTEDSMVSSNSADAAPATQNGKGKGRTPAVIKPTETAVEAVPGKKKSKFWYYAVEPIPGAPASAAPPPAAQVSLQDSGEDVPMNGLHLDDYSEASRESAGSEDVDIYRRSIEGSLSPASAMDES
ncbi:uncharacterized protein B0H18DRAFT_969961 [Fomitopsis serialis]|uniref:uncharacterized protein n=1 Tax=Fomitopsis serialis TaxID=139415 RepID=UPI00200844D2|nr:uncharacterized protein B0H18DRAFT_969961 [Neoantrodia serialis]KAH9937290.1 hypothetical protein B0H18DRAFT_969961 [Neoantrodia serialis]